jgi:hypothetical protein
VTGRRVAARSSGHCDRTRTSAPSERPRRARIRARRSLSVRVVWDAVLPLTALRGP